MDELDPHFWLTSYFNWLYLMLQQCRMSSKGFLESELSIQISFEDRLLVSRHAVLGWVLFFLARIDLENMITLGFWDSV